MKRETKIILCADDFARSHERNLAIDYAMQSGWIQSAGILINSIWTEEALNMARSGGILTKFIFILT